MSDWRRGLFAPLRRGDVQATGAFVAPAALGFLNFKLLSMSLTESEFGEWAVFLFGFTFFDMFRAGMVSAALIKYSAGLPEAARTAYYGAAWAAGLLLTAAACATVEASAWAFGPSLVDSGFGLLAGWFSAAFLVSYFKNSAMMVMQASRRFDRLFATRMTFSAAFTVFLTVNHLYWRWPVERVAGGFVGALALSFVPGLLGGWTGVAAVWVVPRARLRVALSRLTGFGKYSMGTVVGAHLLKSADVFVIAPVLGPEAVALYSVPLRLTEILDICIRGMALDAYAQLSAAVNAKDAKRFASTFNRYAGLLTIVFLLVCSVMALFAGPLVALMSDERYSGAALVLQTLMLYHLLVPFERMIGLSLDAFERPERNFYRIAVMAVCNVVGNWLALRLVGELWAVALVTAFVYLSGALAGAAFLRQSYKVRPAEALAAGVKAVREIAKRSKSAAD